MEAVSSCDRQCKKRHPSDKKQARDECDSHGDLSLSLIVLRQAPCALLARPAGWVASKKRACHRKDPDVHTCYNGGGDGKPADEQDRGVDSADPGDFHCNDGR